MYLSTFRYGITDGVRFHGFQYVDQNNYHNYFPCYGIEANSSSALNIERWGAFNANFNGKLYPGQAVITLRPHEQWGSCYTTHDGGFLNYMQYATRLDPNKGIALEVYKHDQDERVGIKYVEVIVTQALNCF